MTCLSYQTTVDLSNHASKPHRQPNVYNLWNKVYGITKSVVEHHEGFIIEKGILPTSSLPPPTQSCRYGKVWIIRIDDDRGIN